MGIMPSCSPEGKMFYKGVVILLLDVSYPPLCHFLSAVCCYCFALFFIFFSCGKPPSPFHFLPPALSTLLGAHLLSSQYHNH